MRNTNFNNIKNQTKIIQLIRTFFDKQKFTEVTTPILQISPGMEVHLHAFKTELKEPFSETSQTFYLHTSPEFAMKKLLANGADKIYQICHTFRNENTSPIHSPEFLMLEWYRINANYKNIMKDTENLIKYVIKKFKKKYLIHNNITCDPFKRWEYLTMQEVFKKYTNIDLLSTIDNPKNPTSKLIKKEADKIKITTSNTDSWQDIFFKIFMEKIEPNLGIETPTIIYDYPICEAALSKAKTENPNIAERFELYICGIEIANAFTELNDKTEQLQRFKEAMKQKKELYGYEWPIDMEFIEAVGNLPSCSGIALGIDRLIMLINEETNINLN